MYGIIWNGKRYKVRDERVNEIKHVVSFIKKLPIRAMKTLFILVCLYTIYNGIQTTIGQGIEIVQEIGQQLDLHIDAETLCINEGIGC